MRRAVVARTRDDGAVSEADEHEPGPAGRPGSAAPGDVPRESSTGIEIGRGHPVAAHVEHGSHPLARSGAHRLPSGRRRQLTAIAGGLVLLAALLFIPDRLIPSAAVVRSGEEMVLGHGRVVRIDATDPESGARTAVVLILDGERAGEEVVADLGPGPEAGGSGLVVAPDDEVVLQIVTTPDGELVAVSDRWRLPLLGTVAGVFALLVVIVAGWRGIRALIALGLTIGAVVKVLLPLLALGWDPVLLAVATGSVVTITTLLLTEGAHRSTLAATIGTVAALLVTAGLAALATSAARFSVLQGSEEVAFLRSMVGTEVDLGGLILASVILGALGILDDVTITQAVAVEELGRSDPTASRATLAGRAMHVGRAHIAATTNTLVLAYVAAALPLMLLFAIAPQPAGALASSELVAVEALRAMIGSIGIVLAVPFTTFVAARLVSRLPTTA